MKILVTGATGFVGKNLIRVLEREHEIHILVRPESHWQSLGVQHVVEFSGDIILLSNYMQQNEIEGVVHLASLYIAEHKPEQIEDIVLSNIYLGTALLEACKLSGIKWFLNTGTIWQNYNVEERSDVYNPVNLYAASKQAFITMAKYYCETSDVKFCTLKLCDTYGSNDTRRKIFALFRQISESGETLYMSPGEQKLDIIHIDDVVSGFFKMIDLISSDSNINEEYVLTSGSHIPLKQLADRFSSITGLPLNIKWGGRPYRQREVMTPYIGTPVPGWQCRVSLEEGIKLFMTKSSLQH